MRRLLCLLLLCVMCTGSACAVSDELLDAAPPEAQEYLDDSESGDFSGGLAQLWNAVKGKAEQTVRERIRNAALILLAVLLCGMADGVSKELKNPAAEQMPSMVGALTITALTVGSLDSLMGLGNNTIQELGNFSQTLLPALAAATAAAGAVTSASLQQTAAVFFANLLIQLISELLMPMVYLYTGILTAAAILPNDRLKGIADALKKIVTSILSISLLSFTLYLSAAHIISGSADALTVKVAKSTVSSMVPVVGGILSEVSETVLAGAGTLRNTIGIFGMLAVLSACAHPFLQLGVQYLLYKLAALLASTVGSGRLCHLIDGLGGAFGLILGMTGACALTLLVSILASVSAVTA